MTCFVCGFISILMILSITPGSQATTPAILITTLDPDTLVNSIHDRIDPRHDDDMVEPPLICQQDGFFAHPRRCFSFYRCQSSESTPGHFRKEFFNCGPGSSYVQVNETYGFCNFTTNSDNCGTTVRPPTPDPCNPMTCPPAVGNCIVKDLCPNGETKSMAMTLCKSSSYDCLFCEDKTPCDTGMSYYSEDISPLFPTCYSDSDIESMECCNDCQVSASHCQPKKICVDGVMKTDLLLCKSAERVCDPCGKSTAICEKGFLYSMISGENPVCYKQSDVGKPCARRFDPTVIYSLKNQLVTSEQASEVLTCSGDEAIITDHKIIDKYCKINKICSKTGNFMMSLELCSSYYRCDYNVADRTWTPRKEYCPTKMSFSTKYKSCISNKDICSE